MFASTRSRVATAAAAAAAAGLALFASAPAQAASNGNVVVCPKTDYAAYLTVENPDTGAIGGTVIAEPGKCASFYTGTKDSVWWVTIHGVYHSGATFTTFNNQRPTYGYNPAWGLGGMTFRTYGTTANAGQGASFTVSYG
ncbi:hypothetical protein [Streptomyces sp. NRRL S-340]|uniref:hypothetical protein n=1 Tax=Streptomyces sp. NRRL S-340 TaxID=1463901 RepID=UPI000560CE8E|nr:hypothetical protein [Streptomyces sp. NRRL S-340]